jgi:hypothetical protein
VVRVLTSWRKKGISRSRSLSVMGAPDTKIELTIYNVNLNCHPRRLGTTAKKAKWQITR